MFLAGGGRIIYLNILDKIFRYKKLKTEKTYAKPSPDSIVDSAADIELRNHCYCPASGES
jgi:hypothetical protein